MERLERINRLLGTEIVANFKKEKILVVGCGGVGGYVIEGLVRSGFLDLTIVDYDKIDITNCNRQIIALSSTINQDKVEVIKTRAMDINPATNIIALKEKVSKENIEQLFSNNYTYVVDACDDIKAKELLLTYCNNKKIPIISCMGMGKRLDPTKIEITTIEKTYNDPLARKLRYFIKQNKLSLKTKVCFSSELPVKLDTNIIASCVFVPATAGMIIASEIVKDTIKKNKNR